MLEHRVRARRALEEARVASARLRDARDRARRLLEVTNAGKTPRSHDRLRTRMREIESRMQATDTLMRTTECSLAALDDDVERADDDRILHEVDDVTATAPRREPGADTGGADSPDAPDNVDGIDGPVTSGPERS